MRYPASEKLEIIRLTWASGPLWTSWAFRRPPFIAGTIAFRPLATPVLRIATRSPGRVWNRIPACRGQIGSPCRPGNWPSYQGLRVSEPRFTGFSRPRPDLSWSSRQPNEFRETTAPNQLWQTDFTYLRGQWGWFYLSILDDYPATSLLGSLHQHDGGRCDGNTEVGARSLRLNRANVVHKPRLLSDNGSSYISGALAEWLEDHGMDHLRGAITRNPGQERPGIKR